MRKILFLVGYSGSGKSKIAEFFREANYIVLNCSVIIQKALSKEIPNFENLKEYDKLKKAIQNLEGYAYIILFSLSALCIAAVLLKKVCTILF
jgi:dephospho-CoA kinase